MDNEFALNFAKICIQGGRHVYTKKVHYPLTIFTKKIQRLKTSEANIINKPNFDDQERGLSFGLSATGVLCKDDVTTVGPYVHINMSINKHELFLYNFVCRF